MDMCHQSRVFRVQGGSCKWWARISMLGSIYAPTVTLSLIHTSYPLPSLRRPRALVTLTSHRPEFLTTGDPVTSSQYPGFAIFLSRSTRNSFHHPLAAMEPEVSSRQEEPVTAQDTRDSMMEPSQGNAGSAIPESAGGYWSPCHRSDEILSSMEQEGWLLWRCWCGWLTSWEPQEKVWWAQ
jgi:hypothetical protein